MDVFKLFKTKDIEDIKLGIQVIKSLGLETEFKDKIGLSFEIYSNILENIIELPNKSGLDKLAMFIITVKSAISNTH